MRETLTFFYDILLEFEAPVSRHAFVLRCVPPSFPGQEVLEARFTLDPQTPYATQRDGFGNPIQVGCMDEPHDHFRYTVQGKVQLEPELRRAEQLHPVFRFPSPYTQTSPAMEKFLAGLDLPENPKDRAIALAEAVNDHMTYAPGVTNTATTAIQAFDTGAGVCQDFSHVYLALARKAGLAVRYVNGLPVGEGASHAWCEVWLDGIWTGVDPTRRRWADSGYIRLGVGRDFGDCPVERGVFWGTGGQRQSIYMKVSQQ